jgi:hypothetical protein
MIMSFCGGCATEGKEGIVRIGLEGTFAEKEIALEDIADVEYLYIPTDTGYLFSTAPRIIASGSVIIAGTNGDILTFSRYGLPVSRFNHTGSGPEDYASVGRLIYDEAKGDLFVVAGEKINVYSLSGEFRRSLKLNPGSYISEVVDYDQERLLLYDDNNIYPAPFTFISKEGGRIMGTADVPGGKYVKTAVIREEKEGVFIVRAPVHHIVKHDSGYALTNYASDTVFLLSEGGRLSPLLRRSPAIQSMDPVVYLNSLVSAGGYDFFCAVTVKDENGRLPRIYLMRDRESGAVYRQAVTLGEYRGKRITLAPDVIAASDDSRLGLVSLDLTELQDANNNHLLSGKLKHWVESSDEDGNNIFMLLHFKR